MTATNVMNWHEALAEIVESEYDIYAHADSDSDGVYVEIQIGTGLFLNVDRYNNQFLISIHKFDNTNGLDETCPAGFTYSFDELAEMVYSAYTKY